MNSVDVKPHCFYLQIWVEEGFVALVAILVLIFGYLIQSARLYRCVKKDDHLGVCGFLISAGILAYMIAVIAQDSNTCTAPVF